MGHGLAIAALDTLATTVDPWLDTLQRRTPRLLIRYTLPYSEAVMVEGAGEPRGESTQELPPPPAGFTPPSLEQTRALLIKWLGDGGAGLDQKCAETLRERALFIDTERFQEHLLSLVALSLYTLPESGLTSEWLETRIQDALRDLLRRDYERLSTDALDRIPGSEDLGFVVDGLGIDEEKARARVVRFNALPDPVRQAFFAIAIKNIEFDDLVGNGWDTPEQLKEDTLTALEVLLDKRRDFGRKEEEQG